MRVLEMLVELFLAGLGVWMLFGAIITVFGGLPKSAEGIRAVAS